MDKVQIIRMLIKSFGDKKTIRDIAKYAQDEYLIPYDEAVKLIYDSV